MESSGSSAFGIRPSEITNRSYAPNPPSKLKTYGFAIAIIVGVGGFIAGGVGIAGCLGAISNLNKVHAILMMVAGGGGGIVLFSAGIVGTVKNRRNNALEIDSGNHTHQPIQVDREEVIRTTDTQGGLVYGSEAWRIWGVEVLDEVPAAPHVDWDEKDPFFKEAYRENYVLLYIPQKIRAGREEKDLTLRTLQEISKGPFRDFDPLVAKLFDDSASHGWVLVSKKVIPASQYMHYENQKDLVESKKGFRMPHALEVIAANLIIFAFTKERLYGTNPVIYTRCIEKIDERYSVGIGGFGPAGLGVQTGDMRDIGTCGAAAVWKF